jgi:hypothetical protein
MLLYEHKQLYSPVFFLERDKLGSALGKAQIKTA